MILDFTRRTDPAFVPSVWDNLRDALDVTSPTVLHVWTKWPGRVADIGREILDALRKNGTIIAAQVTVNRYGRNLEPRIPENHGLDRLVPLLGGFDHVTWRFDPVIPYVPFEERFLRTAEEMTNLGVRRLVVNTIAPPGRYKRVDRRLAAMWEWWTPERFGLDPEDARRDRYVPPPLQRHTPSVWNGWARWQYDVFSRIVELAQSFGFRVQPCAETAWLYGVVEGLSPAGCISQQWLASLGLLQDIPLRPTRAGCGCVYTVDVGSYGHWSRCGGCRYCYAG